MEGCRAYFEMDAQNSFLKQEWISRRFLLKDKPIPKIIACYAFFIGERCVYVGKTINLRARMALHQWNIGYINGRRIPPPITPVKIYAIELPKDSISHFEKSLIDELCPELNICFNRGRQRLFDEMV